MFVIEINTLKKLQTRLR